MYQVEINGEVVGWGQTEARAMIVSRRILRLQDNVKIVFLTADEAEEIEGSAVAGYFIEGGDRIPLKIYSIR